jgi:hypothetical protein
MRRRQGVSTFLCGLPHHHHRLLQLLVTYHAVGLHHCCWNLGEHVSVAAPPLIASLCNIVLPHTIISSRPVRIRPKAMSRDGPVNAITPKCPHALNSFIQFSITLGGTMTRMGVHLDMKRPAMRQSGAVAFPFLKARSCSCLSSCSFWAMSCLRFFS